MLSIRMSVSHMTGVNFGWEKKDDKQYGTTAISPTLLLNYCDGNVHCEYHTNQRYNFLESGITRLCDDRTVDGTGLSRILDYFIVHLGFLLPHIESIQGNTEAASFSFQNVESGGDFQACWSSGTVIVDQSEFDNTNASFLPLPWHPHRLSCSCQSCKGPPW